MFLLRANGLGNISGKISHLSDLFQPVLLNGCSCLSTSTASFRKSDFYSELGLDASASSENIRDAYYSLSKKYHPDLNVDNPEALRKFHAISDAYATLSNPRLRRKYDTGTLGRRVSAADKDLYSHTFEDDAFIRGRASFRDEYKDSGSSSRLSKDQMDSFMNQTRRRGFLGEQKMLRQETEHHEQQTHRYQPQKYNTRPNFGGDGYGSRHSSQKNSGKLTLIVILLVIVTLALFIF